MVLSIRFDRRRRTSRNPVDDKILTLVEPEEVELLVSPPTQAPGNTMQGSALSFQTLEKKIQLVQLCEKAFFQHLVIAGNMYKIRPNADDGWGEINLFVSRFFEFSILSENKKKTVSYSRRHRHWTSSGSSRCKNS